MIIANIVSHNEVRVSGNFRVVKTLDECIQGLPTLIVGWDLVNKYFPNFDILNKKIEENIYWTFMRSEKRDVYEEDLIYFIRSVYQQLIMDFQYIFVDVVLFSPRKLLKVVKKIYKLKNIITYQHDQMLYIFAEKLIFGIDLELLRFVGINDIKVIDKLRRLSDVFLTKDIIFIDYKQSVQILDYQVKYVPFLFSIKNE